MSASVKELLAATGGGLISGRPATTFKGVSIDTRTLAPGNAFLALRGPRFDGHNFIMTASERGAAVIVVDRLDERLSFSKTHPPDVVKVDDVLRALQQWGSFCRSRSNATVIGVTGSNGKTTTKEMLAAILALEGKTLATPGNLNNHIGLPLTCTRLERDHRFAVIEMGTSQPGDMDVLVNIARPQLALITNVGKDHLEFLKTPEGVLRENRLLYDKLPVDGVAILNMDDPLLAALKPQLAGRVVTYGMDNKETAVSLDEWKPQPSPMTIRLRLGNDRIEASLNSSGRFQAVNALAAAATAYALGVACERIIEGLGRFKAAAMRMETRAGLGGATLINDAYNANPSSMRASIEGFIESYPARTKWVVLGDMRELGPDGRDEHRALGEWLATQTIDRVILYGRDTRFILDGMSSSGKMAERFRRKRRLVEALTPRLAQEKPAVLFKASRRMKLEDVVAALSEARQAAPVH